MEPAILAAYDRPVPRYTSYPTAAQFDSSIGPEQHAGWLGDLKGGEAALYLHVPFCRQLCWYCACHTMAMRREGTLDSYAAALERELKLLARTAPDFIVGSVQWGGGTPTQMGAGRLRAVGHLVDSLFDRRCDAEVSMEVDPRHCDEATVEAMAALGVTRVSVGVQDFDEMVQRAINRAQSFETTLATLERVRRAGMTKINVDLVYGLPHQTIETLTRTLDLALALVPDRFAVFGYAHVPWMKPHQKLIPNETLPDAALRSAMAMLVSERLVDGGYVWIGLDHYARPTDKLARAAANGRLQRNFQGYVADGSPWVVGIGASAISSLPGGVSQNVVDPAEYMAAMERSGFATARGFAVGSEDRLRGDVIGQLMCGYTADIGETCRKYGAEPDAFLAEIDGLAPLVRDGLVSFDGERLAVTDRGRPLVRSVCAAFDRYYTATEGRHARGI
ncbi:MAG: oxygen-independent coproporphyrinogen III oxidase [Rhodospirillales bacterium]|nr:oxygen-independent coproporphyrinogen III oxidase [Rhodospirillales bacterium]